MSDGSYGSFFDDQPAQPPPGPPPPAPPGGPSPTVKLVAIGALAVVGLIGLVAVISLLDDSPEPPSLERTISTAPLDRPVEIDDEGMVVLPDGFDLAVVPGYDLAPVDLVSACAAIDELDALSRDLDRLTDVAFTRSAWMSQRDMTVWAAQSRPLVVEYQAGLERLAIAANGSAGLAEDVVAMQGAMSLLGQLLVEFEQFMITGDTGPIDALNAQADDARATEEAVIERFDLMRASVCIPLRISED